MGVVEGAMAGGWVGPRFQLAVSAEAAIESVKLYGYLPYTRAGGVRFSITANQQVMSRVERETGSFVWPIPCGAGPADPIVLTIEAEQPYVPAAEGSRDRRQLGFVLREIAFLPAPLPTLVPGEAGIAHVAVCADPVIIVGSPRSGTSILAWSLSQHSRLWSGPESDLFWALFGKGRLDQIFTVATEQSHQWLRQERIDEPEFGRWAAIGVNALLTAHSDGRRWIEQSPSNTAALGQIASAMPHAQFVHMLRDGRRVVHSMTHSQFDRPWASDFTLACEAWRNHVQRALTFAQDHPGRCLTIANENLVQNPEDGFRTILSYLHLDDEPGPAAYFQSTRLNSSFSGFRRGSEEPWEEWSDEQRETFDRIAGPMLDDLYSQGLLTQPS